MTFSIAHRIELKPNNKFRTYCRKAFGCARLSWNWGVAKIMEKISLKQPVDVMEIKKEFNAIKHKEFPFVKEVSKYVVQQPFIYLDRSYKEFLKTRNDPEPKGFPNFKKKRHGEGSVYLGGDTIEVYSNPSRHPSKKKNSPWQNSEKEYLWIPNFGWVQMREKLRFTGKINGVTISEENGRFYASFSMEVSEACFAATHREPAQEGTVCGCDWGIKTQATLSNGLKVQGPKSTYKWERKLKRENRRMGKKRHPKTKGDKTPKSKNFIKQSKKVSKVHGKIRRERHDHAHKLTSVLVRNFSFICLETLNVKGMIANHHLAKAVADSCPSLIKTKMLYKAEYYGRTIVEAPMFYASSKTCSACGNKKEDLKLSDRIYVCEKCGLTIDRDVNAARMLEKLATGVGGVAPEHGKSKPVDLMALESDFARNRITTSREEAGTKQKIAKK